MEDGAIEVELLGVARLLARRETVRVLAPRPISLADLLRAVANEAPALAGTVLSEDGGLLGGHALSRDGIELLRDPEATIRPGDRLLLLSTSAGG